MALTELLYGIDNATIGTVELDASVRERHTNRAKATDHPVEAGEGAEADVVTDHVRVEPEAISIEGVVSNTPAIFAGAVQAALGGSFDPAGDAHKQFLEDLKGKKLVAVVTTLKTYTDMVLEGVSVVRNAKYGNALYFTATAKHVRKVTTQTVDVQKLPTTTKPSGKKPTKPPAPPTEVTAGSLASKLLGLVKP